MRILALAFVASSLAACANDVTAPTVQPTPSNSLVATADSGARWGFGRRGFGMGLGAMFAARRLPDNLKLTDAQKSQIKSLVSAYRTTHRDDLQAMASVGKQAFAARRSGVQMSVEERRALFAQTAPARQRLAAANKQLRADIEQVLTSEQRSWLASHRPQRQLRRRAT